MARILGIDYGIKRCGISATDPLQILVNSVDTVGTDKLKEFIIDYCHDNEVEKIVIGKPTHRDGTPTYLMDHITKFSEFLSKQFPDITVDYQEESFSSVHAKEIILKAGIKKKKRQDKALIDKVSAVVILQRYLKHI